MKQMMKEGDEGGKNRSFTNPRKSAHVVLLHRPILWSLDCRIIIDIV